MKRTIFITGATSGIGRLVAEMLAKDGHIVYATGRNETALAKLKNLGIHTFRADLRDSTTFDEVISRLPTIDVAILNAGIGHFEYAVDLTDEQVVQMVAVNIMAPILLAKKMAPMMIDNNSGHFIFICSQAGKVATKKASVYAASKHAITGFVNGFRQEMAEHLIQVTGIYPGPIDTPFIQKADASDTYREAIKAFLLPPEKVAREVVRAIDKRPREVNLPRVMSATSKLYALAPALVEFLGKGFFNKK